MKTLISGALVFAFVGTAGCAVHGAHGGHGRGIPLYAEKVGWHTLEEGRVAAARDRKPMVVDFAVPYDCDRCDFLQENVYSSDAIVEKLNRDFVPIWINLSAAHHTLTPEEEKLGRAFEYRKDCLLLFLDPEGNIIHDPEGKRMCFVDEIEPGVFMEYLDYVREKYVAGG